MSVNPSLLGISSVSFLLVAALTPLLIWGLRTLKLTQPIRAELPPDHQAKRGTPLMAGLILIIGVITSISYHPSPMTMFLAATFLLFGSVGLMDDLKKSVFRGKRSLFSNSPLPGYCCSYSFNTLMSVRPFYLGAG